MKQQGMILWIKIICRVVNLLFFRRKENYCAGTKSNFERLSPGPFYT